MLIKNALIVTMDKNKRIINGDILIEGNKITKIGKDLKDDEIIDAKGMVALPGFVNTHGHVGMTLLRGQFDDMQLQDWLKKCWELESKLNAENVYISSLLGCIEMIKAGITFFADMYYFGDSVFKAVNDSGIRCLFSQVIVESPYVMEFKNSEEALKILLGLINRHKNDEKNIVSAGPHAIYTCSEETLLKVKEIADENNLLVHIHLSETKKEVEDCLKNNGKRPVEYLDSLGFLSENVLAVHCCWLTEKEIKILKEREVRISHCPVSNMKLATGIAPVTKLIDNGISIGIGTDSSVSNNRLDMFQEMKIASILQKINNFNTMVLTAEKILEMATIGGAKALGIDDRLGSIEVGKLADIILIDFNKPHLTPMNNVYSHLVYAAQASDVDTVICNGKVLMKNRRVLTINENEVMEKAELAKEDLLSRK
jgi:5-methylthioadenosine/S-adenosylhomocysteine deaminase